MSHFVVLEGIDGSGKTTQARLLAERMDAELTREPTDGPFGRVVRDAVEGRERLGDVALALGFAADRAHHSAWIADSLADGRSVVSDRYVLSSLAYQPSARVRVDWLTTINEGVIDPSVTVFLDTPVAICAARIAARASAAARFDSVRELARVRSSYLAAMSGGEAIVDGDGSTTEVAERVWDAVRLRVGG